VTRIIAETTFEERIEELPTVSKKSSNFVRSVADGQEKAYKRLPPSKKFADKFEEFAKEVATAEGSHRAKSSTVRTPYEVGKLPSRKKVKMSFYDIADCPWPTKAAPYQTGLFGSNLYPEKSTPTMRVNRERVTEWETMNRECVSIASHTDYFIAAGMNIFQTLLEKAENEEEIQPATIWNVARMGMGMMFSAGMGVQDLTKNIMWEIGEQVVTRRDQWLVKMKDRVSDDEILKLRAADVNGSDLFDAKLLQEAQEKASVRRTEKVQDQIIHKVLTLKEENVQKNLPKFKKPRFEKQNFKQSFRGDTEKSESFENVPQRQASSFRGKDAGRGRGGGRGRGQFNKKAKFSAQPYGKF
jgi:hypothetical protein